MSNRSTPQILETDIIPALFEKLDQALPEFGFVRFDKGWRSTSGLKVDGSTGKEGKVVVLDHIPNRIFDYTRGNISLWDYVKQRDGLDQQGTLQRLAELAGVPLLNSELTPAQAERIQSFNRSVQLWEDLNDLFIDSLHNPDNPASKSIQAQLVTRYLVETRQFKPTYFRGSGTGFDKEYPKMEAGLVAPLQQIENYLRIKGYSESEILRFTASNPTAGRSHLLSFPYRDAIGRVRGMVFRSVTNEEPKYLYSAGLEKDQLLFNQKPLRKNKDLVVVEGILDALHCSAVEIENVVALGGTSLSPRQIEKAIQAGTRRITLMLDNDQAGRNGTLKALDLLLKFPQIKPFVAVLPIDTDPDEVIRDQGPQAIQDLIKLALPGYLYRLWVTIAKYGDLEEAQKRSLTEKEKNDLLEDIQAVSVLVTDPVEKDLFIKAFVDDPGLQELGITHESLKAKVDQLQFNAARDATHQAVAKLLTETQELQKQGKPLEALEVLSSKVAEIQIRQREPDFTRFLAIPTEQEIGKIIQGEPDGVASGYWLKDAFGTIQELELPAGALSIIAARTSHRKTGLMMNLALNIGQETADKAGKEVHFFSYEESREAILCKLLNIYINEEFRAGIPNLKYIKNYYKKGGHDFQNPRFLAGKAQFFSELINTGRLRVHYSNLKGPVLADAIRALRKHSNVGVVFIDYIQLLGIEGKFQSRQLQLQAICELLREAAIDTGLPIILGAQFNREVNMEEVIDSSKLRECGDIEQTADLVLGLWDRKFSKLGQKDRSGGKAMPCPGELYVEALKGRTNGAGSSAVLNYVSHTGRISSNYPPEAHWAKGTSGFK
ncbi:hypothetical protein GCM10027299_52540 [Larkinella ripae]